MTRWRYAAAAVPGTAHTRAGTPCQDRAHVVVLPETGALIAVAADGAGSAAKAEQGAQAACAAFAAFGQLALSWLGSAEHLGDCFPQAVLDELVSQLAVQARAQEEPIASYACTLLGALVTEDAALFLQVGDGAITFRTGPDAPWRLAAPAKRGEFANETVFLTSRDAARHLQAVRLDEPVHEVALMTDGVEFLAIKQATATPHDAFFEHVIAPLRAAPGRGEAGGEVAPHARWIEAFLNSSAVNQRTDDDKTLILATRACPPG